MRLAAPTLVFKNDCALGHRHHKLEHGLISADRLGDLAWKGTEEERDQLQRGGLSNRVFSGDHARPRGSNSLMLAEVALPMVRLLTSSMRRTRDVNGAPFDVLENNGNGMQVVGKPGERTQHGRPIPPFLPKRRNSE